MKNKFRGLVSKLNSEKFSFAGDLGVKALAEIFNSIFGILTFSILARALNGDSYAVVNQFVAVGALIAPIILFKFTSAFVVFLSGENNKNILKSRYFTSLILSGGMMLLFCFACLMFSEGLSYLMFGTEEYAFVVNVMGIYYSLLSISELSQAFLRAIKHMKKASIMIIIKSALIFAVFLIVTMVADFNLLNVIWLYTSVELVMAVIVISIVFFVMRGYKFTFDIRSLKEYYKYALPLMPYSILSWLSTFVGRFIVNHLLSLSDSAVYGFNSSLIQRAFFMTTVIGYTVFPYVSRFWNEGKKDKVVEYMEKAFNIGFLCGLPIVLGLYVTLPSITQILSGGNYAPEPLLMLVLGFGMLFHMMFVAVAYLIDLSRKTMWYNIIFLVSCGANIGLNFILIPIFGIMGAAIALLINYVIQFVLTLAVGTKTTGTKIKISLKHLGCYTASVAVMTGIASLIYKSQGILNFIITALVAAAVYFVSVFVSTKLLKIKLV